jgi:hypothetical protein
MDMGHFGYPLMKSISCFLKVADLLDLQQQAGLKSTFKDIKCKTILVVPQCYNYLGIKLLMNSWRFFDLVCSLELV